MKIVIDMNLGLDWAAFLEGAGHEAVHWSAIGRQDDDDADIMRWAAANQHAVLTADLDFGTLLAASQAPWPSIIQLRALKTPPSHSGPLVLEALSQARYDIEAGALVTIQVNSFRIRPLPI